MVELLLPCEKLCDKTSSDLFGLGIIVSENPNILRLLRRSIILLIIGILMVLYEIIDSLIDKNIISVFLGIYNLIVYKCAWNAIVDKNVSSATWFSYCGFFSWISMVLILLRAISLFNKGHNVIFIISYTTTETIVLVGLTWNINKIKSKNYFTRITPIDEENLFVEPEFDDNL